MELAIDRLTKQYKNKIAVDRVSIKLKPGVYGLLGANGAGKTTLMRMICDIQNPTSGQIKYNGTDIKELGEDYRQVLGYLPQDFGYYPDFTAYDFLMYIAALKGLSKEKAEMRVNELLQIVNLENEKKQKVKTFSGGMKQRLGIAQAMLNNPKILILDEPTAGLDPKERVKFRNLISSFSQDKIVILSTHIVSDIEFIADEIIVMKAGKKILTGTPEELLQDLRGSVWKCVAYDKKEVEMLNHKYCIINIHQENNTTELRIVSRQKPTVNAVNIEPNLEDLYLAYFQDNEKQKRKNSDGEKDFSIEIYNEYLYNRLDLLTNINRVYANYNTSYITELFNLNLKEQKDFYETRQQRIEEELNQSYDGKKYTPQEKEYWLEKSNNTKTPFEYDFYYGYSNLYNTYELLIFGVIAICICLASVFAGEYQNGTDKILLTTKYGKSKGVTAKIIASYIFATLVFTIYLIFAIGTTFLMFGTDGGNLPIQLSNILSPYALTFFQSLLYNIVISYTVLFGMVGLTLFLSSKLKNPMTVLVIDIAIIMLPVFLSIKSAFGILNKILFLMPYNAIYSNFSQMVSYKLGNIVIDLPMMTIIAYIFMMVIALICAKKTYSKHQVE